MARRPHLSVIAAGAVLLFLFVTFFMSSDTSHPHPLSAADPSRTVSNEWKPGSTVSESILKGGSVAPKLENATAKAELGRATWKFLHTTMARFPEKPTPDESETLKLFITLFSRLYPCGECAAHFRTLLEQFPPQTSSRQAAAGWACHVHNQVNKRLQKPEFNCNDLGDFYDCGCGDEDGKYDKDDQEKNQMRPKKEDLTRGI